MTGRDWRNHRRRSRSAAGLLLGWCLLLGCRTAPARFAGCEPDICGSSRTAILLHQQFADTAAQAVHRPFQTGRAALSETGQFLHGAGQELVVKRVALTHVRGQDPPADAPGVDPAALESALQKLAESPLQPADVRLYPDGAEALAALVQLIDGATCRLDVLMFLWDNDPVGWEVARRLAARAGPDLPVRVLVDGGGNLIFGLPEEASFAEVNRVVCWLARQPYVEVIRTRNACLRYDHRKLVLADGRAAWSGGRNFTERSFFFNRDLSFTVTGPLTEELDALFEESWREQGGPACRPQPDEARAVAEAPLPDEARVVATGPARHDLAEAVYRALDCARHHVYVENVYFSDAGVVNRLIRARQRGCDVRAVLTIHSNSDLFNRVNRATANRLRAAGVRVYLYPGMTHVKAAAVDGCWVYVGTGNFDPLSMRHDRELGVAVSAGPVIAELEERLFRPACRDDWELKEPLPLSLCDRAWELLAGLFL